MISEEVREQQKYFINFFFLEHYRYAQLLLHKVNEEKNYLSIFELTVKQAIRYILSDLIISKRNKKKNEARIQRQENTNIPANTHIQHGLHWLHR